MKDAVGEFFLKFVIHSYDIKPKIMFWVPSGTLVTEKGDMSSNWKNWNLV